MKVKFDREKRTIQAPVYYNGTTRKNRHGKLFAFVSAKSKLGDEFQLVKMGDQFKRFVEANKTKLRPAVSVM
ncbi:MAG: hypothetical protein KGJ60_08060 [Verrucomicrobiota bacterium]|nr:hypothetical protein [Verrucomicrobiota bacterium]